MKTFQLLHGTELIGTLRETQIDQPWIYCRFEPEAAFTTFKPLFDRELELLGAGDVDRWDEVVEEVERNLKLIDADDPELIHKFLLHIDGDEAWFRYMTKAEAEAL